MPGNAPATHVEEQPPKVDCQKCLENPSAPEPLSRAVPRLTSWTEVLKALELPQAHKSDHTHSVSALLAIYELAPMVECGLPDRTHHHWGCVVRTTCGLRLNIGHECGRRRIPELRDLIKKDSEAKRHEERVAKMRTAEHQCAIAEGLRGEVVAMIFFVENLQAHAPPLAHELREIARGTKEGRLEVNPRWNEETRQMVADVHVVVGTQLFDERLHPDADYLRSQIDYVRQVCKGAGDEPNDQAARHACTQIDALREAMREAELWAGQARRFFSSRNFAEALFITHTTDTRVSGDNFVTPDKYEIGLRVAQRIK